MAHALGFYLLEEAPAKGRGDATKARVRVGLLAFFFLFTFLAPSAFQPRRLIRSAPCLAVTLATVTPNY